MELAFIELTDVSEKGGRKVFVNPSHIDYIKETGLDRDQGQTFVRVGFASLYVAETCTEISKMLEALEA